MATQNNAALAKPLSFEEKLAKVRGSCRNPAAANSRMDFAARECHLVSPSPSCAALPEGCEVAFASVTIDIANETYEIAGDDVGLSRVALDKLAGALGISWDATQSRRLDDGSDSRYVHFKVVGLLRDLDGTIRQIQGEKEMDLREGSAQIDALRERFQRKLEKWEAKGKKGYAPKPPDAQINEMRLHILSHAESKARLRAIRSCGVRSKYSRAELKKPFVVARLAFTGRTDDPELRRAFAMKTADAMLGAGRALYGASPATPAPAPAASAALPPPPVGRRRYDDEEVDPPALRPHIDAPTDSPPPSASSTSPGQPKPDGGAPASPATVPATSSTSAQGGNDERPRSGVLVKFGDEKGTAIEDASDETLEWYAGALGKSLNDPEKARWKAANEKDLAAIRAERKHRRDEERADDRDDDEEPDEDDDDFAPEADRGDSPEKY